MITKKTLIDRLADLIEEVEFDNRKEFDNKEIEDLLVEARLYFN